ncbi:TIGR03915 family putative DNA repair protein [Rhizosphaericola mali]|uniref:DNA metabolism protein n=1 Tax=Rhizosphaericola mali TaxID=2545455 RepID=A0A5P2FXA2_9BACT|nr:TIGR03915 family putative DNA repair protein [Rhizosphaericola mali]QES88144.1 DNA metabolism protein [Rhizosphaericola mali]
MIQYIYDGSFGGFLCCVFECFERREFDVQLITEKVFAPDFFALSKTIVSDKAKAKRVLDGLTKSLDASRAKDFFRVFLSEDPIAIQNALGLIIQIFQKKENILENYGEEKALYFSQTLKKVGRERHRMKAFIRFEKSSNGMFFAVIAPDFNVLPLIIDFFTKRYTDQTWLIYDEKRHYGILYDKTGISEIEISELDANAIIPSNEVVVLDLEEQKYQQLWKSYFKSTNIEARKNMKLHLRHVPKRYWRYLTEKK